MILTLILILVLTLSYPCPNPFSTLDPDPNPNSNPNPYPTPNPNLVRLANLFEFGLENGKIALRFKELSDYRKVPTFIMQANLCSNIALFVQFATILNAQELQRIYSFASVICLFLLFKTNSELSTFSLSSMN